MENYIAAINAGPSKIEGGELCRIQEKPSVVSIQRNSYHICGGGIISDRHIITSASCITLDNLVVFGNLDVFSGTADLFQQGTCQINKVHYVIIHPHYDAKNFWRNDIAILKVCYNLKLFQVIFFIYYVFILSWQNQCH